MPRDQRRTHLGNEGCQTCGCNGCSKEDFVFRGEDPEYHPEEKTKEVKKKDDLMKKVREQTALLKKKKNEK